MFRKKIAKSLEPQAATKKVPLEWHQMRQRQWEASKNNRQQKQKEGWKRIWIPPHLIEAVKELLSKQAPYGKEE